MFKLIDVNKDVDVSRYKKKLWVSYGLFDKESQDIISTLLIIDEINENNDTIFVTNYNKCYLLVNGEVIKEVVHTKDGESFINKLYKVDPIISILYNIPQKFGYTKRFEISIKYNYDLEYEIRLLYDESKNVIKIERITCELGKYPIILGFYKLYLKGLHKFARSAYQYIDESAKMVTGDDMKIIEVLRKQINNIVIKMCYKYLYC